MTLVRLLFAAVGLACLSYGGWLLRDLDVETLRPIGFWLLAGPVAHDGVLAPLVVGAGVLTSRFVPRVARTAVMGTTVVLGH